MNTPTKGGCPPPPCSAFHEGMRVQRLSQHRIKGEVDYMQDDGKVMVTWDVCGRWPIDASDLRVLPNIIYS